MDTKNPLASKTLWGAAFLLASFISTQFFGVEITPDDQEQGAVHITTIIEVVGAAIGFFLTIWGRFTATTKLSLSR